jgi:hypothetical protein
LIGILFRFIISLRAVEMSFTSATIAPSFQAADRLAASWNLEVHGEFVPLVTPECFDRGSSPKFAWIPAKSTRE